MDVEDHGHAVNASNGSDPVPTNEMLLDDITESNANGSEAQDVNLDLNNVGNAANTLDYWDAELSKNQAWLDNPAMSNANGSQAQNMSFGFNDDNDWYVSSTNEALLGDGAMSNAHGLLAQDVGFGFNNDNSAASILQNISANSDEEFDFGDWVNDCANSASEPQSSEAGTFKNTLMDPNQNLEDLQKYKFDPTLGFYPGINMVFDGISASSFKFAGVSNMSLEQPPPPQPTELQLTGAPTPQTAVEEAHPGIHAFGGLNNTNSFSFAMSSNVTLEQPPPQVTERGLNDAPEIQTPIGDDIWEEARAVRRAALAVLPADTEVDAEDPVATIEPSLPTRSDDDAWSKAMAGMEVPEGYDDYPSFQ